MHANETLDPGSNFTAETDTRIGESADVLHKVSFVVTGNVVYC